MNFTISNPAINDKTVHEIINARDKSYASRIYRQVIYLVSNTHYIEEERFIEDCFTILKLGIYLNSQSNYFTNINFLSFLERRMKKFSDEENDIFYKNFSDTIEYIDNEIVNSKEGTDLVNLKQYKTRLITVFRKQHIKLINE